MKQCKEEIELTGRLAQFRDALNAEIEEIDKNGNGSIILTKGRAMPKIGSEFRYSFYVEYIPSIVPDTPCDLKISGETYSAIVISCEDTKIILATQKELEVSALGKVQLQTGSTQLMKSLIKRIEDNRTRKNELGDFMFSAGEGDAFHKINKYTKPVSDDFNEEQYTALKSAIENDVTFIWGPPGTGKTKVISVLLAEILNCNRTALLASHTNTAVDNALIKTDSMIETKWADDEKNWPILRVGVPSEKIKDRLTEKEHIKNLGEDLEEKEKKLKSELNNTSVELDKAKQLKAKIEWVSTYNGARLSKIKTKHDDITSEIRTGRKALGEIRAKLSTEDIQKAHEYQILKKKNEVASSEFKHYSDEREKNDGIVRQLRESIDALCDDIKKRKKYDEITKQYESELSISTLEEMLNNKNIDKDELTATCEDLGFALEKENIEFEKFRQKGYLARLMAAKKEEDYLTKIKEIKAFEENKTKTLHMVEREIADIVTSLDNQKYRQQKMRTLKVTDTVEVLESKRKKINGQISAEAEESKRIVALQMKAEAELSQINNCMNYLDFNEEEYEKITNGMDALNKRIALKSEESERLSSEFNGIVKEEIGQSRAFDFSIPPDGTMEEQYNGLQVLYKKSMYEVKILIFL